MAARRPTKYQTTPLVTRASTQRVEPPITGTPKSGRVGTAAIARTKPGIPRRAEFDPTSSRADRAPITDAIATAVRAPHDRTIDR